MTPALVRLALARSFPAAWTLLALILSLLIARSAVPLDASGLGDLPLGLDADLVVRSLARQNTWTGLLLVWLPGLLVLAATAIPGWRQGEVDWLAAAAVGRGTILRSTWMGGVLAAGLVLLGCAVVVEVRAGEGPPGRRLEPALTAPEVLLFDGDGPRTWELEPPASARALRVPLVAVLGGAVPTVRLALRRADTPWTEIECSVAGRITRELPLPPGSGPVEVRLERLSPGAGVAILGQTAFVSPAASERLASVGLLVRAWLALAAWGALALGLGAWFSGATATLGTLAIVVATEMASTAPAWLPGRGLGRALEIVGAGFVPANPGAAEFAGAAAVVLLAGVLGRAGLRTWRRA